MSKSLEAVPLGLDEGNKLVRRWHRHHLPVRGHKFTIGAVLHGRIVGTIIVGRPVAQSYDDGSTLEVTRCATDGTPNACSYLYGRARAAAFALGYRRLVTYTRTDESGASLRGAGFRCIAERKPRSWAKESGRPRVDKTEPYARLLWEA